MALVHVVLSGGVGSRLWPLSRKKRPKQYLPLFLGYSLFQLTLKRNQTYADRGLVVGNQANIVLGQEELSKLDIQNRYQFITEAKACNTAPAILFAALSAQSDDVLLVTPADHIIENQEAYGQAIIRAKELAEQGYIVTFGIQAKVPSTAYGYIEYKQEEVLSFREKPSAELAQKFIEQGNYAWNAGIFCFKASTLLEECLIYQPQMLEACTRAWKNAKNGVLDIRDAESIPVDSIDYAILEKSHKIKMVEGSFEWSDLGAFDALYDYMESQQMGNFLEDKSLVLGTGKKVVNLTGKPLIIVETEDAILLLDKNNSQKVKEVYSKIEKEFPDLA